MAGWVAYSHRMMNQPILTGEEARAHRRSLLAKMGVPELADTWREEALSLGGRELRLYHFASEPGDPVVVHAPGTGSHAIMYAKYLHALSRRGFNVVGYDPRGHGASSGKRGIYTLGELVEDALAVIDHAIAAYGDEVAVCGDSQGGMTAFYCAAAEPRLKAAVCHSLIAPDEPDNTRMTRWPGFYKMLAATRPLTQPVLNTPLGHLMLPVTAYLDLKAEESETFPDLYRYFKEDPVQLSAVSFAAISSLDTTPMARRVEEIEVPVMVVHGAKDIIFPEDYVRRVYGRLRCEKEFLYLPHAAHGVMLDNVDEIVPPIAAWLKKVMRG
ncbi:MAG: alpha/beta hydrolase [Actinobacteria bacterium]|nr:alpha/beta hydrolase [Actinomycetota bacterium]